MLSLKFDRVRYSPAQFGLWRASFGFYLFYYYLRVWPFAVELYSDQGPFAKVHFARHLHSWYPETLLNFDSVDFVHALLSLCLICSFLILIGFWRRTSAFALWIAMMWLYNRTQWTDSPEAGFVNWLVFALIFIPIGESYACAKRDPDWHMPKSFYWGAWIVLSIGYLYAGGSKLREHDSAWFDGTALYDVVTFDNSHLMWYGNFFDHIPMMFFRVATWCALPLQFLTGIFVCFRRVRPWWWLVATGTHIAFLGLVNLGQLTWGMIFFHFFLFDYGWYLSARAWFETHLARKKTGTSFRLPRGPAPPSAADF